MLGLGLVRKAFEGLAGAVDSLRDTCAELNRGLRERAGLDVPDPRAERRLLELAEGEREANGKRKGVRDAK
jgi:hypothetical protein